MRWQWHQECDRGQPRCCRRGFSRRRLSFSPPVPRRSLITLSRVGSFRAGHHGNLMHKLLTVWIVLAAIGFCAGSSSRSSAGCIIGGGFLCNSGATPPVYQGPGDVASGITSGGSVYRAYAAAYANGTNPLADLVDSSTGLTPVCTLRVATTGFADVTKAYCGGQTPANACAAAAGGGCKITKLYDQPGGSTGFLQATPANMPAITFNDINGLPAINCGNGSSNFNLQTSTTFSSTTIGLVTVYKRTAAFTTLPERSAAQAAPTWAAGLPRTMRESQTERRSMSVARPILSTMGWSAAP